MMGPELGADHDEGAQVAEDAGTAREMLDPTSTEKRVMSVALTNGPVPPDVQRMRGLAGAFG
eukprot:2055122-Pyramimonas_sp.AAC.1